MKKFNSHMVLLIAAVLLGSLFCLGGCGGGGGGSTEVVTDPAEIDPMNPASGDMLILRVSERNESDAEGALYSAQIREDVTVLEEITYLAQEVEPASVSQDAVVMFFLDKTEVLNQATGKMVLQEDSSEELTPEAVRLFLQNHWDAFADGDGDEGWNGREFLKFLDDQGMTCDTFLELFNESGMSLSQYVEALRLVGASLYPQEGENALEDFEQFLDFLGLSFASFAQAAEQSFGSLDDMLDWLRESQRTLFVLLGEYAAWYASGTEPDNAQAEVFFRKIREYQGADSVVGAVAQAVDPTEIAKLLEKAAELGLNIAKFGWEIVKANETQIHADGAFTYAYLANTDFASYYGAKDNKTSLYGFELLSGKVGIVFGPRIKLGELYFRGLCTYDAKHRTYEGHYLPNVEFEVSQSWCTWPNQINASVAVSNVTNMGSTPASADITPRLDLVVNAQVGNILKKIQKSFRFRAQGSSGIAFIE